MKRKKCLAAFIMEAVVLAVLSILAHSGNTPAASLFAFPFGLIADGLLLLAKSGRVGNGAALAVLVCISAVPTVICILGWDQRTKAEKAALSLTSLVTFAVLYGMMLPYRFLPPALCTGAMIPFSRGLFGVTLWSWVVVCVAFRLLHLFRAGKTEALKKYLVYAVLALGALFVGFGIALPVGEWIKAISGAQSGADKLFAVLRFAAAVIPYGLDAGICIAVADLLQAENVESLRAFARKTADWCCLSLGVSAALTAVLNGLQVAFLQMLSDVHTHVDIPVVSLAFALMILLISRLLVENQNLRDDNNLFI